MFKSNRRDFVRQALFGMGGLGLRALATGLPPALIMNPLKAMAQTTPSALAPQFMLLSTSSSGDPVNVYAPGSYLGTNISRSADPTMASAQVSIGGTPYTVGGPWANLPVSFWSRACFFHHATETIAHGDDLKVLDLMGGVRRGENIVSIYGTALQPLLGTVSSDPVPLDTETLTAQGRPLARLSPLGLQTSLISQPGALTDLRPLRDQTLDAINNVYQKYGTAQQKTFLDRLAQSQAQARMVSDNVLNGLASLKDNGIDNEILAAILLFKMKITPAAAVHLSFGGDNHVDKNLYFETQQHNSGIASIAKMITALDTWGLTDNVTFVMLNVFGRSMTNSAQGRGHNGGHNVGIIMGKNVNPSVIGGITLPANGSDYVAQNINSTTGAADPSGDIAQIDSLGALGQTIGVALGLPEAFVANDITQGTVVKAALAT